MVKAVLKFHPTLFIFFGHTKGLAIIAEVHTIRQVDAQKHVFEKVFPMDVRVVIGMAEAFTFQCGFHQFIKLPFVDN